MGEVDLLGVQLAQVDRAHLYNEIRACFLAGERVTIATPNPEILVRAARDESFRAALSEFDVRLPDGFGLILLARLFRKPLRERLTGVDAALQIARIAAESGSGVFLLGGSILENRRALEALHLTHPNLRLDGLGGLLLQKTDGVWNDSHLISERINALGPSVLFVALGHGKQEYWIRDHLAILPKVRVAIGVGGALAMIGGLIPRAPTLLRRLGLEWFWRLLREPRRFSRIFTAVVVFPVLAILHEFRKKK